MKDEVLSGHPLWGKGLQAYSAHIIAHSRWLAEAKKINMIHPRYNPEGWETCKHYLLLFHDDTFECLASSYETEVFKESLERVVEIAQARLLNRR